MIVVDSGGREWHYSCVCWHFARIEGETAQGAIRTLSQEFVLSTRILRLPLQLLLGPFRLLIAQLLTR